MSTAKSGSISRLAKFWSKSLFCEFIEFAKSSVLAFFRVKSLVIVGGVASICLGYNLSDWPQRNVIVPIKIYAQSILLPQISVEEAYRVSRQFFGHDVVYAQPFRNVGDSNQFIAIWTKAPRRDCDVEEECPFGHGAVRLYLARGARNFEIIDTKLRSVSWSTYYPEGDDQRHHPMFFDLVDWNSDGVMEALSISSQSGMTSPYSDTIVAHYDIGSRKVVTLRGISSNTEKSVTLAGVDDPSLEEWLRERYNEFNNYDPHDKPVVESCTRDSGGMLKCAFEQETVETETFEDSGKFADMSRAVESWIASNGGRFVFGKLIVDFRSYELPLPYPVCSATRGNHKIDILFKGDVLLTDMKTKKTTVLYVKDGRHHRELNSIVIGKSYFWLPVLSKSRLVAINRSTFESVPVKIGIPVRDLYLSEVDADFKERLLSDLRSSKGKLFIGKRALKPVIDSGDLAQDEFQGALSCK